MFRTQSSIHSKLTKSGQLHFSALKDKKLLKIFCPVSDNCSALLINVIRWCGSCLIDKKLVNNGVLDKGLSLVKQTLHSLGFILLISSVRFKFIISVITLRTCFLENNQWFPRLTLPTFPPPHAKHTPQEERITWLDVR